MTIAPQPRLSVVDRQGRIARKLRMSVTDRCAMRCFYCMPDGAADTYLDRAEILTFEELVRLARVCVAHGIDRVRLTGGEPLGRRGIERLVEMLKTEATVPHLSMTTNALGLFRKAAPLRQAGLDSLTFSLDTLDRAKMNELTGGDFYGRVMAGIDAAATARFDSLKMNAVAIRGVNDDELPALARFGWSVGAEPRFIEFMPFGDRWGASSVIGCDEIVARVATVVGPTEPVAVEHGSTALRFRVIADGRIFGVIPTMGRTLCAECDRIRVTADGRLLGCLFAATGPSVRDALRTADGTDEAVAAALRLTYVERGVGYLAGRAAGVAMGTDRSRSMHAVGG